MTPIPRALPLVLVCLACTAPAHRRDASSPGDGGYLITAERIRESGAADAWEALVRTHAPIRLDETPNGEPAGLSRRGQNSLVLSSTPMLVVDEVIMTDFVYLRRIPAESIAYIRILNGAEGTMRYGTGAGNGVVVVRTEAR